MSFVFGCLFGSFLNVCIYRLPLGMSVNKPARSFCFRCGTPIKWYDNIPVISYLILGGRDRACGAKYSPRYALVELLTGLVFLWIFLTFNEPTPDGFSPMSLWYMAFAALLIIGVFTDFDHWIIPEQIPRWGAVAAIGAALLAGIWDRHSIVASGGPFPALGFAGMRTDEILFALFSGPASSWAESGAQAWWQPVANSLIGAVFAPFFLYSIGWVGTKIFRKEAMGFGDVELFVLIGATVGAINSVLVLIAACFLGSIVGGGAMIADKIRKQPYSPMSLGEWSVDQDDETTGHIVPAVIDEPDPDADLTDSEDLERTRSFAEGLEMEFADLSTVEVSEDTLAAFPADLAHRLKVFPLSVGKSSVKVAARNPLNTRLVAELRQAMDRNIRFVIASERQIVAKCLEHYGEPPAPEDKNPLWKQYAELARVLPVPKQRHHIPFIPWIAAGGLLVVVFQTQLIEFLRRLFNPTF